MIDFDDAEITHMGILDMQVCVPWDWSDSDVELYANKGYHAGTANGWYIRKQGHKLLNGDNERVQCERHAHRCHIMLDC